MIVKNTKQSQMNTKEANVTRLIVKLEKDAVDQKISAMKELQNTKEVVPEPCAAASEILFEIY